MLCFLEKKFFLLIFAWLPMKCFIRFFVLFLSIFMSLRAQELYQFSGLVLLQHKEQPLAFSRVWVKNTRRGTIANEVGFFSLPVTLKDTIIFQSLGAKTLALPFKDFYQNYTGDKNNLFVYSLIFLQEDSITLPEVTIRPFKNAEEVKMALLNMPFEENLSQIQAQNNLQRELLAYYGQNMELDGKERLQVANQLYWQQYRTQRMWQVAPIDPITLARFINHIVQKSKAQKPKHYDYWPD